MAKLSLQSKILFFLILGLSVFIPLYPKFPLENVSGTYVAIRLEDILVALTFLIWILLNLRNIKRILQQPITQSMLIFWGVGLLSLASAILITYSVKPHLGLLNWLRRIEYMGLFFVGANAVQSPKQLKIFIMIGVVTAALVTLYGFGEYFGLPVISTTNSEYAKGLILKLNPGARPNSTFAGHYDLAAYLSVVLIFLVTLFFDKEKAFAFGKQFWSKLVLILIGIGNVVLLGLTASRMSFAAAILGLIGVFWITGRKLLIVGILIASILVVVAVPQLRHRLIATVTVNLLGGGGAKYQIPLSVQRQLQTNSSTATFSADLVNSSSSATNTPKLPRDIAPGEPVNVTELGVERSFNIRTDIEWPRALMAFEKNPLLGTGYSSITIATDNDLLRSLGEVGILGTVGFMLVFVVILKQLWVGFKNKTGFQKLFILSTIISIGVLLFTSMMIDIFEASKIALLLWILLGIAWSVSKDYQEL